MLLALYSTHKWLTWIVLCLPGGELKRHFLQAGYPCERTPPLVPPPPWKRSNLNAFVRGDSVDCSRQRYKLVVSSHNELGEALQFSCSQQSPDYCTVSQRRPFSIAGGRPHLHPLFVQAALQVGHGTNSSTAPPWSISTHAKYCTRLHCILYIAGQPAGSADAWLQPVRSSLGGLSPVMSWPPWLRLKAYGYLSDSTKPFYQVFMGHIRTSCATAWCLHSSQQIRLYSCVWDTGMKSDGQLRELKSTLIRVAIFSFCTHCCRKRISLDVDRS